MAMGAIRSTFISVLSPGRERILRVGEAQPTAFLFDHGDPRPGKPGLSLVTHPANYVD